MNYSDALGHEISTAVMTFYLLIAAALAALIITLVVEIAVAALLGFRSGHRLEAVLLVNLVTNPVFGFIVLATGAYSNRQEPYNLLLLAMLEALVVVAEWRILVWALDSPKRKTFILSVAMNAASVGAGFLIWFVRHPPA